MVLLDEADIFLQNEYDHHVSLDVLVSFCLRRLECTGKHSFIDNETQWTHRSVFGSRVHLPFHYLGLESVAKQTLDNLLQKIRRQRSTDTGVKGGNISNSTKHALNSRQIKDTVASQSSLALEEEPVLSREGTCK